MKFVAALHPMKTSVTKLVYPSTGSCFYCCNATSRASYTPSSSIASKPFPPTSAATFTFKNHQLLSFPPAHPHQEILLADKQTSLCFLNFLCSKRDGQGGRERVGLDIDDKEAERLKREGLVVGECADYEEEVEVSMQVAIAQDTS